MARTQNEELTDRLKRVRKREEARDGFACETLAQKMTLVRKQVEEEEEE